MNTMVIAGQEFPASFEQTYEDDPQSACLRVTVNKNKYLVVMPLKHDTWISDPLFAEFNGATYQGESTLMNMFFFEETTWLVDDLPYNLLRSQANKPIGLVVHLASGVDIEEVVKYSPKLRSFMEIEFFDPSN